MKLGLVLLNTAVSLAIFGSSVHAAIIAQDGFDYGATGAQLWGPGQAASDFNGGTGWGGAWTARGGNFDWNKTWACAYGPTSNLSVTGLPPSAGGGVIISQQNGGEGAASTRAMASAITSGTYYVGLTIQVNSWGWDPNVIGARFLPQGIYDSEFGAFGLTRNGAGASVFYGSTSNKSSTVYDLGASTLQRLVLKMDLDANTAHLYSVTDGTSFTGNEADYDTGVSGAMNRTNYYNPSDTTQYPWIGCEFDFNYGNNGGLDDLTIATTFSEAVGAVPEPASLSLLGLGAVALLNRRKSR